MRPAPTPTPPRAAAGRRRPPMPATPMRATVRWRRSRAGQSVRGPAGDAAAGTGGGDCPYRRRPAAASPWAARLPDDFDPFAPPPAPQSAAPAAPDAAGAGAFADLIPSGAPSPLDDLFGLKGGGGDPLAAFLADAKPAAAQGLPPAVASTDPLVLFGAALAAPTPPPEVAADRTPELRAAFSPPRPAMAARVGPARVEVASAARTCAPPRAAPAIAPAPTVDAANADRTLPPEPMRTASPAQAADAAGAWAAFCEGAGVKVGSPEGADPAFMRVVGMMLRASVDGTLQLMAVRQATRQELHAQVTMIQAAQQQPAEVLARRAGGAGAAAAAAVARLPARPRRDDRRDGRPARPRDRHHGRHARRARGRAHALRPAGARGQAGRQVDARQRAADEPQGAPVGAVPAALRAHPRRGAGGLPHACSARPSSPRTSSSWSNCGRERQPP